MPFGTLSVMYFNQIYTVAEEIKFVLVVSSLEKIKEMIIFPVWFVSISGKLLERKYLCRV